MAPDNGNAATTLEETIKSVNYILNSSLSIRELETPSNENRLNEVIEKLKDNYDREISNIKQELESLKQKN